MMIKLPIAEDNRLLLKTIIEKLSFYSDLEVKFHAYNGLELLESLEKDSNVHLILMDIEMPKMNGIAASAEMIQKFPHIKIIMLTVFDADENIFRAIQAGANVYFFKEVDPKELHQGILYTLAGVAAMTPSVAMQALKLLRNPPNFEETKEDVKLSPREIEVLIHISKRLSYIEISENLFISSKTVRKHIYQKLQVHNKLAAVQKAVRNRIIER